MNYKGEGESFSVCNVKAKKLQCTKTQMILSKPGSISNVLMKLEQAKTKLTSPLF